MTIIAVCTGNACRSPMAEGLLKNIFRDHAELTILSAGTGVFPGSTATEEAILAVRELGADIRTHRSQMITHTLMNQATLVIAMTQAQAQWLKQHFPKNQEKVLTLGELAHQDSTLDISDPIGHSLDTYREIAAQIQDLLQAAYALMLEQLQRRR
ncbi:low molecular weight protein arginine phosphatase [bacterium]|nr:low molecular weight protein arginine phosphatase [bacterium]